MIKEKERCCRNLTISNAYVAVALEFLEWILPAALRLLHSLSLTETFSKFGIFRRSHVRSSPICPLANLSRHGNTTHSCCLEACSNCLSQVSPVRTPHASPDRYDFRFNMRLAFVNRRRTHIVIIWWKLIGFCRCRLVWFGFGHMRGLIYILILI